MALLLPIGIDSPAMDDKSLHTAELNENTNRRRWCFCLSQGFQLQFIMQNLSSLHCFQNASSFEMTITVTKNVTL